MTRPLISAVALGSLLLAGCGGGADDKRVDLKGKATFGGKPIVFGTIDFVPDGAKGHTGPAGSATIEDGRYDTSGDGGGAGIFPGPHTVRVTAYDSRPPVRQSELEPAPMIQALVTGYTVPLDLKASPVDIEVPESAKGKDFSKGTAPARRGNEP